MSYRVGIIGARGIGKFHAREFSKLGCEVVALMGKSEKLDKMTSNFLENDLGINFRYYSKIDDMIKNENLDVVSICCPVDFHFEYSKLCLDKKINVFCEKPLTENFNETRILFEVSERKNRLISVNTQWSHLSEMISDEIGFLDPEKEICIEMESGGENMKKMLQDHLPHVNSFIIGQLKNMEIPNNFKFKIKGEKTIEILFKVKKDNKYYPIKYVFTFKNTHPKKINLSFGEKKISRRVDSDYNQFLLFDDKEIAIEDPLNLSIKDFLDALQSRKTKGLKKDEIFLNVKIYEKIMEKFREQNEKEN